MAEQAKHIWQCGEVTFDLAQKTLVMGILNVTPDSFSDGGLFNSPAMAVQHALEMEKMGADIIDVGGESTRPGSAPLSQEEEMHRVIPIIRTLKDKLAVPISIDTYKSSVAEKAIEAGAKIINDISGGRFDDRMAHVAAKSGAGFVLMHIKGQPRNMQQNPTYDDLLGEIISYLQYCISDSVAKGVKPEQIVIDPGIGFGKRLQDNFEIIRKLGAFSSLGRPILVGPSRKSFIGAILNVPPAERLEGTLAAVSAAVLNGADIVRVHDVKETRHAIDILDAITEKAELPSQ